MIPIHVVEIDPKVVESAELCFGLDTKHVKVFCEDARDYLKRNQGRSQYDIVFLDVFGPSGIPDDLVSIEFVKVVYNRALFVTPNANIYYSQPAIVIYYEIFGGCSSKYSWGYKGVQSDC